MMTKNLFAICTLAVLTTVSSSTMAIAQGTRIRRTQFSKATVKPTLVPNRLSSKVKFPQRVPKADGQLTFSQACDLMAPYRQWMIGANSTGYLYPKNAWNGPASSSYNLKGLLPRKFLQYEKQGIGRGINIGWTNDASATTAVKRGKWFFSRESASTKPIVYGEALALAWGNSQNSYVKYGHRTVGINLDWSSKPVYEWAILGGRPGQPVRKGKDVVILYNLKHKQPLRYFKRTVGGHIGWPDSKTWKDQAWDKVKKEVTIENAVKVMREIIKETQSS